MVVTAVVGLTAAVLVAVTVGVADAVGLAVAEAVLVAGGWPVAEALALDVAVAGAVTAGEVFTELVACGVDAAGVLGCGVKMDGALDPGPLGEQAETPRTRSSAPANVVRRTLMKPPRLKILPIQRRINTPPTAEHRPSAAGKKDQPVISTAIHRNARRPSGQWRLSHLEIRLIAPLLRRTTERARH